MTHQLWLLHDNVVKARLCIGDVLADLPFATGGFAVKYRDELKQAHDVLTKLQDALRKEDR